MYIMEITSSLIWFFKWNYPLALEEFEHSEYYFPHRLNTNSKKSWGTKAGKVNHL